MQFPAAVQLEFQGQSLWWAAVTAITGAGAAGLCAFAAKRDARREDAPEPLWAWFGAGGGDSCPFASRTSHAVSRLPAGVDRHSRRNRFALPAHHSRRGC